jgi:hypothetical protein
MSYFLGFSPILSLTHRLILKSNQSNSGNPGNQGNPSNQSNQSNQSNKSKPVEKKHRNTLSTHTKV